MFITLATLLQEPGIHIIMMSYFFYGTLIFIHCVEVLYVECFTLECVSHIIQNNDLDDTNVQQQFEKTCNLCPESVIKNQHSQMTSAILNSIDGRYQ